MRPDMGSPADWMARAEASLALAKVVAESVLAWARGIVNQPLPESGA